MTNDQIEQLVERTELNVRKGILMYAVLHVLKRGPVYSSDVLACLREANMIVVEGTVYPLLSRLQQDGIVSYEWRESESGPPRKYYRLTQDGRRLVMALQPKVAALFRTIHALESDKLEVASNVADKNEVNTEQVGNNHKQDPASHKYTGEVL